MRMLLSLVLFLMPAVCLGQETDAKTHKVAKEHFKIDVSIDGVIESNSMHEIAVETESWSDLKISEIVDEGKTVAKGDLIVKFETDSIDKSIEEAEYNVQLGEYGVRDLEIDLEVMDQTLELDQALAERTFRQAKEDFDYFNEVERPMSERSAQNSLKSSQWSLENSQEELDQLQKMYNEDELTEESEAIVLKRAKRSVEQSEFWLERSQQSTKRTLETSLPRSAESKRDSLEREKLKFEKSKISLPMALERKKIEFEKSKYSLNKQTKALGDLKSDRKLMSLTAPNEGLVYHGRCVRGKWSSASGSGARQLKVGNSVSPKKVFLTIVDPADVFIRCDLDEAKLGMLKVDMEGKASLVAFPDKKAKVIVDSISYIPISAGKFDCTFRIEESASLMPGMTCKIKVRTYENADALTVPSSAVFTDDDESYYVYVKQGDGNTKREVTKGKSHGDKTEITEGLSEGDEILLSKPK